MNTFISYFEKYIDISQVSKAVQSAQLVKLCVNKDSRILNVTLGFDTLVDRQELFVAEKVLTAALKLSSCEIFPKFPRELFSASYYPQLVTELRRRMPSINGTLTDSVLSVNGNVLDIELTIPVTEQGPGYGSAILAMVGAGQFENVNEAIDKFFEIRETVKPSRALVARYADRYEKYRRIYPAVKKLYKEIKE